MLQKKVKNQPRFRFHLLTPREIRYCMGKRHFAEPAAARIAAKQACLALFQIPQRQMKVWARQMEVTKRTDGKPALKIYAQLKAKIKLLKEQKLFLSLAHERDQAIAWVLLTAAK